MVPSDVDELTGLAQAAGSPPGPLEEGDSLAVRARAWFVEAYTHPLWVKFRTQSEEDMGFYVGGEGQWSQDGDTTDYKRLKDAKRAAVSINHVQAMVDILTGFERQNRFDPKVQAQGEEDEQDARLMTWLLKFIREQSDAQATESDVFEDGAIVGMSAANVRIDWTEDPLNGSICVEKVNPGVNVIWDPQWERDDLSDARYVILYKRVFVSDLIAQYPDKSEAIRSALNSTALAFGEGGKLTEGNVQDNYGSVKSHPTDEGGLGKLFYDATEDSVLVLEPWYREYEDVWIVANKASGQVHEAESASAAKQVAASDPDNLTAIRRQRRIIRMGVVLPAAFLTLEEDDTPYDNDTQNYSVVPFLVKRKREDIYGMVRNLKDPQRVENKRESQMLDLIARYANMRPMAEEGGVVNVQTLHHIHDPAPIMLKPGHPAPTWFVPPLAEIVKVLTVESDRMKLSMREISGINTDLLGQKADDTSGIAIARRQAQGQIISTVFFDNYKKFKRNVNERLARRIQQVFTSEQVFRLTSETGEGVVVKINPMEGRGKTRDEYARTQAGVTNRMELRNLQEFLKYDVVISEAPSTPTMRMMQLLGILEVLRTLPNLGPLMMDKVVERLDIEDKPEILQRVRAAMGQVPGRPPPPTQPMAGPGPRAGARWSRRPLRRREGWPCRPRRVWRHLPVPRDGGGGRGEGLESVGGRAAHGLHGAEFPTRRAEGRGAPDQGVRQRGWICPSGRRIPSALPRLSGAHADPGRRADVGLWVRREADGNPAGRGALVMDSIEFAADNLVTITLGQWYEAWGGAGADTMTLTAPMYSDLKARLVTMLKDSLRGTSRGIAI